MISRSKDHPEPSVDAASVLTEPLTAVPWVVGFFAGVVVTLLSVYVYARLKPQPNECREPSCRKKKGPMICTDLVTCMPLRTPGGGYYH